MTSRAEIQLWQLTNWDLEVRIDAQDIDNTYSVNLIFKTTEAAKEAFELLKNYPLINSYFQSATHQENSTDIYLATKPDCGKTARYILEQIKKWCVPNCQKRIDQLLEASAIEKKSA